MTLSITIDNVGGHPNEVNPSVDPSDGSIGDATTNSNKRGHPGDVKPSGGKSGGSIGDHVEGRATTTDNGRLHPGEVKPSGGISGDAIGGHSEGGENVKGTEVPLCRTPSTSTIADSSGQTTVRTVNSPTTLPPITGTSLG